MKTVKSYPLSQNNQSSLICEHQLFTSGITKKAKKYMLDKFIKFIQSQTSN